MHNEYLRDLPGKERSGSHSLESVGVGGSVPVLLPRGVLVKYSLNKRINQQETSNMAEGGREGGAH